MGLRCHDQSVDRSKRQPTFILLLITRAMDDEQSFFVFDLTWRSPLMKRKRPPRHAYLDLGPSAECCGQKFFIRLKRF
jgi:hypothetical protein